MWGKKKNVQKYVSMQIFKKKHCLRERPAGVYGIDYNGEKKGCRFGTKHICKKKMDEGMRGSKGELQKVIRLKHY